MLKHYDVSRLYTFQAPWGYTQTKGGINKSHTAVSNNLPIEPVKEMCQIGSKATIYANTCCTIPLCSQ